MKARSRCWVFSRLVSGQFLVVLVIVENFGEGGLGYMEVQRNPPPVEEIVNSLTRIVSAGLPVSPGLEDDTLLGLRGVVARSVDSSDRLSRVKSLDDLLRRLVATFPDDTLGDAASQLFGIAPGSRGASLTLRRERAARTAGFSTDHFRKNIEPKIIQELAWLLHRDSQNYVPRERATPPPLEISGDTPYVAFGDVTDRDRNEHEEALSRLWAHVYALRAEILKVERLKQWPHDVSEPETSQDVFLKAIAARDREIRIVKILIERYIGMYGESIAHGEGEFSARALLRLAGWEGS